MTISSKVSKLVLICGLATATLGTGAVIAKEGMDHKPGHSQQHKQARFLLSERGVKKLDLTEQQQTQLKSIFDAQKAQFKALRGNDKQAMKQERAAHKAQMQALLDFYKTGVNITSVSLQSALPPEPVQEAFEDVNRANQDYQRQINEGQAYANAVVPKARGNAARLLEEAEGYKLKVENEAKGNANRFEKIYAEYVKAPEVTRQRLFIEAQEQILSNVSKVIVDQKKGGSLLYLPLDKLMQATSAQSDSSRNTTQSSASVASDKSAKAIENERALDRDREREN